MQTLPGAAQSVKSPEVQPKSIKCIAQAEGPNGPGIKVVDGEDVKPAVRIRATLWLIGQQEVLGSSCQDKPFFEASFEVSLPVGERQGAKRVLRAPPCQTFPTSAGLQSLQGSEQQRSDLAGWATVLPQSVTLSP